jgi:hypothetical protein
MRRLVLVLVAASSLVACSGGSTPLAVIASSGGSIGVGEQRMMFALVDQDTSEFLAAPDHTAVVTLRNEDGAPLGEYPTEFLWTIQAVRGLYVAYLDIPSPGTYQVTIEEEGYPTAGPSGFVASDDLLMIQPGEKAPLSVTRVGADYPDLSVISTDPDPDPEMYRMTVADAVSDGTPSVVVFATPGFCTSQTCGPMLDQVKAMRPRYAGVDFVHVEIYDDLQVASFDDLTPVEATEEWGLPSEPWVFVVDASGTVTASFEGSVSESELASAIDAVAS